jgi:hypothetical protein
MINRIYKYYRDCTGRRIAGFKNLILQTGAFFFFLLKIFIISLPLYSCGGEFETLFDVPSLVYWSEENGSVNHIYSDGTGRRRIISSDHIPLDIVADRSGGYIFRAVYFSGDYYIKKTGTDGSGNIFVHSPNTDFGPSALSFDEGRRELFWNQYRNVPGLLNNVWKSDSDSIPLGEARWASDVIHNHIYSICVDTINRKIYFSSNSYYDVGIPSGSGNSGSLFMRELDIETDSNLADISDSGPDGDSVPFKGIAVDGRGGYVYYVKHTSGTEAIMRSDLNLSNSEEWIIADGFDISKIALDLNNRKIYWTSFDNKIYRGDMDRPDSGVEVFLNTESTPTGIALD